MKTIIECACGIARDDCDYHAPPRPAAKPVARKYAFMWDDALHAWIVMGRGEEPYLGKFLTSDGYIHTFVNGKLTDEEPAQ